MSDWKAKRWEVLCDAIVPSAPFLGAFGMVVMPADSMLEIVLQTAAASLAVVVATFSILATAHRYIREAVKEAKGE